MRWRKRLFKRLAGASKDFKGTALPEKAPLRPGSFTSGEGKKCQPQRSDLGEGQLTDQEAVTARDYVAWILPALNWSQAKKYDETELQLAATAHSL